MLVAPAYVLCDYPLDHGLRIDPDLLLEKLNIPVLHIIIRESYDQDITVKLMLKDIVPDLLSVTATLNVLLKSHYKRVAGTHFTYHILINRLGKTCVYKAAGIALILKRLPYLLRSSYHASEGKQSYVVFFVYYLAFTEPYRLAEILQAVVGFASRIAYRYR